MKTLKEKFWLNEEAETPHCEMSYRDYEAVGYFQGQKEAYEDVKEAVLQFEIEMYNIIKERCRYEYQEEMVKSILFTHRDIFGDFNEK